MIDINDLAADLDAAIESQDVVAAFQPQISLRTGQIVAVETLCRWEHPVLGVVAPDAFIAVAERTGSIHRLGGLMLDAALDAAASWRDAGRPIEVSVNVSPLQLAAGSFIGALMDRVRSRTLSPQSIILEITESQPLVGSQRTIDLLHEVRAQGFALSLDDFGTGNASLEHLENLPVSEVKLHGSLIRDAEAHSDVELREVLGSAREHDVRVVAEGVETQAQLERAALLRCDRAQGYLICRPRPKSDIDELLRR